LKQARHPSQGVLRFMLAGGAVSSAPQKTQGEMR
jgi:hypothetical protein